MSDRTAHPYQAHSPTRFVERGVAAPFTVAYDVESILASKLVDGVRHVYRLVVGCCIDVC